MDFWDALSYSAWALAALFLAWILLDAIKVGREYGEDFLLSSREGEE